MKKPMICLLFLLAATAPAHATGGMTCRTAGARPVEVVIGFGHVPGAPLFLARLVDDGRQVPVRAPQWWLDSRELRILLASPDAMHPEAIVRTTKKGHFYDGSLWRNGRRRWIRCRES
jgi:hypothetical protein